MYTQINTFIDHWQKIVFGGEMQGDAWSRVWFCPEMARENHLIMFAGAALCGRSMEGSVGLGTLADS